ncbi:SDR family NAD(P)-dependent oxidoreductase [Pseudonocardia pini]|uniref:SDR family NAD(P)-dependent oxidoreductase n=1 Tax=Pseudonocardia pini TaxID=2758030 RepID=UPI0015F09B91|nr:SDR family oxidoreductase [Pseudonocardia pini]
MIDLGLEGKRAVVAGAGYNPVRAGHGRWSAQLLGAAGASVACVDIDEGRAKAIAAEITEAGGQALPIVADVREPDEVVRAFDLVTAEFGGVDVCVDIVGLATWDGLLDITPQAWDAQLRENLTQVFYVWQEAARRMVGQGSGGSLVALASIDGMVAAAFHGAYGAAKAGVISLAKTFAHEFGRYGIRANVVAPGNVGGGNMDQPPGEYAVNGINPLAAPRTVDIANSVLFLCSDLAARTTGQVLVVDGGATTAELWGVTEEMLPGLRVALP